MITIERNIDIISGKVPEVIHLSQYDSDFVLVFHLYASNGALVIASGTTAKIRGTKTDGNGYSAEATLSGTDATVQGHVQMTAVAGRQIFEICLMQGKKELNTANFVIDVERAAMDKDTLESDSVLLEAYAIIDRTDEIVAAAQLAAQSVKTIQQDAADARSAAQSTAEDRTAVDQKAAQIVAITTEADQIAAEALSTANNAENHMASLDSKMSDIETALENVSIDPDDLGLYQDEDTMYVYPTYRGVRSENGIPLASKGGGGGGGGEVINAKFDAKYVTEWNAKTIVKGGSVSVQLNWSSIEDGAPTGDGSIRISVNDQIKTTYQIKQGLVTVDLTPYVSTGTNKVKIRVSDVYDQGSTKAFNITCVELSITSTFDSSKQYTSAISFPYVPVGAVNKTVHFILDGNEIGTQETLVSGKQMTYTIPAQTHGGHSLRVYFTALLNGETVSSNELYYEFIFVNPISMETIVTSSMSKTTFSQFSNVPVVFQVYNPTSLTAEVKLYANDELISTQTVGREQQSYAYKANNAGPVKIDITSGGVTKTVNLTIEESEIDVKAETENLELYMTSHGRSNNEEHPEIWNDQVKGLGATLTGFNFISDGWQTDSEGATCLRVAGNARVTIPYNVFANDIRQTGFTVEVEFSTRNVANYNATVLSCFSNNRGLTITPQNVSLKSDGTELTMQYKEGEHIRVAYTVEKRSEDRLVKGYIDGTIARAVQYPTDDDFVQTNPVGISIGSSECAIDIYCIRVYSNDLVMLQVLDNWIADTQDGSLMLERYTRNNIYDAYGKIVISQLPAYLPYFILDAEELPQYKGDKKIISGSYVDPMYPSKSFTFTGMQINVQGTSSAPYYRKNFDMQFKNGFEMTYGHADKYKLKPNSIPTNRFVTKADVASSEAVNNTQGVQIYNDLCPYKTPEMEEDARVRWGIDGFPIVIFWHNTLTDETTFYGKANFNFPKRFPAGYGYEGDDESWEFQNNTSNLMLFLTDYFDNSLYTDPETGETKERWRYDYEARFPDDTWIDYSKLQILQSFIYSTYRDGATGAALETPVTYEGTRTEYVPVTDPETGAISYEEKIYRVDITYENDTADYRLAKFKAEFGNYAELDSFIFYYVYTEFFLMVDSRAKNLFIGFHGSNCSIEGLNRKAVAEPYDMDTQMGIDNEGVLRLPPYLEDTDKISGANVFNGQTSVLWNNLRDAFPKEIQQMYQNLRSGGLKYDPIEARFDEAQAKWPEALWGEDSQSKYFDPLVNPEAGKEPTDFYLPMCQGTKRQQRRSWLTKRFAYMDSKWNAGDASLERIQLRGYAKSDITVTPYINLYPTVKYGSYVVSKRAEAGVPTLLACPIDTLNDTEIYIYSARNVASVGDLSGLKVGVADFSYATNIQEVKLGDASSSYDNPNMKSINFGNNKLLKKIDCRNCSGLGKGERTAFDISGCEVIEEVYFDGTNITGLTLPNGGVLKKLHLPATVTNLTIMNQKQITEFVIPSYANITTLRLENVSSVIDEKAILRAIAVGSRVRLVGIYWECQDAAEIDGLLDILDTMRGLDEQGGNVDTAQVSGTIHASSLTGAQIAEFNARYPYVTVVADHVTSYLRYYNYNSTTGAYDTLMDTVTCTDGVPDRAYGGTTPTRAATAAASFAFNGWSKSQNAVTPDADAETGVIADRNIYASYAVTGRTYTVTFVRASADGGGTLQTINNVAYGTLITAASAYTGATPTTTQGDASEYPFEGWSPASATVQGNTTFTAVFGSQVEVAEIPDSWDEIIAACNNGTAATKYKVGNYKQLDAGSFGTIEAQITGVNKDPLASGSGTAQLTFGAIAILNNGRMNPDTQYGTKQAPSWTASGNTWTSQNRYAVSTAVAVWTVTATEAGTISVSYKASNSDTSRNKIALLEVNGETVAQNVANTTAVVHDITVEAGDTVTIRCEYALLQATRNYYATIVLSGTGAFTVSADIQNAETRDTNAPISGTGAVGGWKNSERRAYVKNTIKPSVQENVRNAIKEVTKYTDGWSTSNTKVANEATTEDLWLFSAAEIFGLSAGAETMGPTYTQLFKDSASRIKKNSSGSAANWWLRSAYGANVFRCVSSGGYLSYDHAYYTNGVVLGFCL